MTCTRFNQPQKGTTPGVNEIHTSTERPTKSETQQWPMLYKMLCARVLHLKNTAVKNVRENVVSSKQAHSK